MLLQADKRSIVMRRKLRWACMVALKSAALEHQERITNWLGVLTLLALGVVWL